jgi:hypothetical protein
MILVTDILYDQGTGDIACKNGDFVIGDSTLQHQADLLEAAEGEYKQSPTVGVGLQGFLNDENPADMLRKIRIQFVGDGLNIVQLQSADPLNIKANYQ